MSQRNAWFTATVAGLLAVVALSGVAQAQARASCTFSLFLLNPNDPNNPRVTAYGVNDNGAVVGSADFPGSGPSFQPFLRRPTGNITYFLPNGAAYGNFTARNNAGVTVGSYVDTSNTHHAFMWKDDQVIQLGVPKSYPHSTFANGINKFNTVVGSYLDFSLKEHAFKRFSDGSYLQLDYPGATATVAEAINDNGAIVGTYTVSDNQSHGFIYFQGAWATLNYLNAGGYTELHGISNAGVILGNPQGGPFIYEGG